MTLAEHNDRLRCHGLGGLMMLSRGVAALDEDVVARIFSAVRAFDQFTPENDPHGEHDCAIVQVDHLRVMFKIDYYDRAMEFGSPNPLDTAVTVRVLTIMLAHEY